MKNDTFGKYDNANPDLGKLPVEIIPGFCYDNGDGIIVNLVGGVLLVNQLD